jgi:hypothetical protein
MYNFFLYSKDTSRQPDYKQEVSDDLALIESRMILFNDMLSHKNSKTVNNDPALEDLLNGAKSSQKKIMEFITSDDGEDRMGYISFTIRTFIAIE